MIDFINSDPLICAIVSVGLVMVVAILVFMDNIVRTSEFQEPM